MLKLISTYIFLIFDSFHHWTTVDNYVDFGFEKLENNEEGVIEKIIKFNPLTTFFIMLSY